MFYSQRKLVLLKCALVKSHSAVNFKYKWPFVVTNSPFKSCRKCQPVLHLSREQFKMPNKIHMRKLQGIGKKKKKERWFEEVENHKHTTRKKSILPCRLQSSMQSYYKSVGWNKQQTEDLAIIRFNSHLRLTCWIKNRCRCNASK